jgi:site-specific recombinase XerC
MKKAPRRGHQDAVSENGHVTAEQLHAFRAWIENQGLASTTAAMYEHDARSAAEVGFRARLRDETLAPKTLHRIRAAGRQWAKFRGDAELELALKDFKLPAARRQTVKMPIERSQLFMIVDELAQADYLTQAVRAVIGLMACRGFRVGDVLRMRRVELVAAFETGVLSFLAKGRRRLEFGLVPSWEQHARSLVEIEGWTRIEDLISPRGDDEKMRRKAAAKAVQRALTELAKRCAILKMHPHRLRRTYAVEYLRQHAGDPEALLKLTQHMQWADESTALQYVNHVRGRELDAAGERIFVR